MKKTLLLIFLISQFVWSQKQDPRQDKMNFTPGKIIVKLKDNVDIQLVYVAKNHASNIA